MAQTGTVKKIISDKGFGFIRAADGTELFFHRSAVKDRMFDELREGSRVTFEQGQGPKGPRADTVQVV